MKFIKTLFAITLALFAFTSCNNDDDNTNTPSCEVNFTIEESKGLDLKFETDKVEGYAYDFQVTQTTSGKTTVSKEVSNGANSFVWGVDEGEYTVCLEVRVPKDKCQPEKKCNTLVVTAKNIVDANKSETEKTEVFKDTDGNYKLRFLDKDGKVVD